MELAHTLRSLMRVRLSKFAAVVLGMTILVAVLAPWLAPHGGTYLRGKRLGFSQHGGFIERQHLALVHQHLPVDNRRLDVVAVGGIDQV